MNQKELNIPSSIESFDFADGTGSTLKLFLKRDDLIHPVVSGNKWRKLKLNLLNAKQQKFTKVLTYGGAYSNHLVATAYAAHKAGLKSIGIVRGLDADLENHSLKFVRECGMEVKRISREEYRFKNEPDFLQELRDEFGPHYRIPEGGANFLGVEGCMEIITESETAFKAIDFICTSIGTGTTLAGMLAANSMNKPILGFTPFKKGDFLRGEVSDLMYRTFLDEEFVDEQMENLHLVTEYHFGGFGKVKPELKEFVFWLKESTGVQFDLVYNGKMLFGLYQMIKSGKFKDGDSIIILHCGGVQGNVGFD